MNTFRSRLQRLAAHLDGPTERRAVALTAALLFAVLAFGPRALQAVDGIIHAPEIRLTDIDTRTNPLRFQAMALNADVESLSFVLSMAGGTRTLEARRDGTASRWESEAFDGVPGQSHDVFALAKVRGGGSLESRAVTFTVPGYRSFGPVSEDPERTVAIASLTAWPGPQPSVEARGATSGFIAEAAAFHVRSLSGLAFLGEYPAERDIDNAWRGSYALPAGEAYEVTLVAKDGDAFRASPPREVRVPAAEADAAAPTPEAPVAPPEVALLFPPAGGALSGPVPLAARVGSATAVSLSFDVLDPAGVIRTVEAAAEAEGRWTATFTGSPGTYHVGARAALEGGASARAAEYRTFRIEAASGTPAVPAAGLSIELSSPADNAAFAGPSPISARVRGGVPERVVAVVTGMNGETVAVASKTAGDFWNALFEGPAGDYRVQVRAIVGGKEVLSSEVRFRITSPAPQNP